MSHRHLILRLEAPLISFGGVAIDHHGVTDAWPAASLLTGLLGNALGLKRTDAAALDRLQERLVFACRADREGEKLYDYQTAEIKGNDKGWTTRGRPEGRAGGAGTYAGMHIRHRYFWADRAISIALRLEPIDEAPELDTVAAALDRPARPLFFGRKPCLPAARILAGEAAGETALLALATFEPGEEERAAFAPATEGVAGFLPRATRELRVSGRRNWTSGVHGGEQRWLEGRLPPATVP